MQLASFIVFFFLLNLSSWLQEKHSGTRALLCQKQAANKPIYQKKKKDRENKHWWKSNVSITLIYDAKVQAVKEPKQMIYSLKSTSVFIFSVVFRQNELQQ